MPLSIRPKAGEKLAYGFHSRNKPVALGNVDACYHIVLFPFACGGVGSPHANSAVVLLRELETNSLMT